MLKYKSIIDKLSREQKTALLTNLAATADPRLAQFGIPPVRERALGDCTREGLPAYESLICSWDPALIGEVTAVNAAGARAEGYNLFVTPDLKCAANDLLPALSEDACLNGAAGAAMVRAVHEAGGACALAQLSCSAEEVNDLDVNEDGRAVDTLFCAPFRIAAQQAPGDAVFSSLDRPCGGYGDCNVRLFGSIADGIYGEGVLAHSAALAPDVDYHRFLTGCVCLGGGALPLDRALGRYEKIVRARDAGSTTERELQGALEDGTAVDPAVVDGAVDRVIDFAFRVGRMAPAAGSPDARAVGRRAAYESIVLLKNRGALPLAERARIAVIGNDAFAAGCGLNVTAQARGYVREEDGEELVVDEAVRAANEADVVVIFLQPTRYPEGGVRALSLPANTLALIAALKKTGRRMVGILPANTPVDMAFDVQFDAVLTAPVESAFCAAALGEVLSGKASPCGRLARSYADDTDTLRATMREDRDTGRTRVGAFVGYRYFDTAGVAVRYPFGYGLSYTQFVYSRLRIEGDRVTFTVKNVGKRSGCEVAQVYVGAPGFPAPKKELKAFVRVPLAAGESREVSVEIGAAALASYDDASRSSGVAEGRYLIYVGASVSDIRLKGVRMEQGRPARREGHPNEYFRDLSNIGQTYRLSAARGVRRTQRVRWGRIAALVPFLGALIALAVLGVLLFFRTYDAEQLMWPLIIMAAVFLVGMAGLITEHAVRKSSMRRAAAQKMRFQSAVLKTSTSPEVFDAAFAVEKEEGGERVASDEPNYFDRDFTFAVIGRQLKTFLEERGVLLGQTDLSCLLGAFAATRVIFFPAEAEAEVNALCAALAEYFGTKLYADTMDERFHEDSFLYLRNRADGLAQAVIDARREPSRMHVALCRGVRTETFGSLVFARTFEHAARLYPTVKERFVVPPNLWIVALPDERELSQNLWSVSGEMASMLDLELHKGKERQDKSSVQPLGFYQFSNLCDLVRGKFPLDERLWKRVDRLEQAVAAQAALRVGNRVWIRMERFVSVCLACGGEDTEALDRALASQMLPGLFASSAVRERGTDEVLAALEEIFGADLIGACRKMLATIKQRMKEKGNA